MILTTLHSDLVRMRFVYLDSDEVGMKLSEYRGILTSEFAEELIEVRETFKPNFVACFRYRQSF